MSELYFLRDYRNRNQFKIDYPYYGLFGSADITILAQENEVAYQCRLLNGSLVTVKKSADARKWIDAAENCETPLSATLGIAIEDFLKASAKDRE